MKIEDAEMRLCSVEIYTLTKYLSDLIYDYTLTDIYDNQKLSNVMMEILQAPNPRDNRLKIYHFLWDRENGLDEIKSILRVNIYPILDRLGVENKYWSQRTN